MIEKLKAYLKKNLTTLDNVTLIDSSISTVCNRTTSGYHCKCEDQYFWPCDVCKNHKSCGSITNNTCICVTDAPNDEQFCQPISQRNETTKCQSRIFRMSVEINETFDTNLTKPDNDYYKAKAKQVEAALDERFRKLPNYIKDSAKVTGFRSGSIIADYTIHLITDSLTFTTADINESGGPLALNNFFQTEQNNLSNRADVYPEENVTLQCPQTVEGQITWKVPDGTKYYPANNNMSLVVESAAESGRYSCIIHTNSVPYVQWEEINIKQQPRINVSESEQNFVCDGSTIQLKCCVNANYNVDWFLNGKMKETGLKRQEGCITINHTIQSEDCPEEIFTCKLKGLPQLLSHSYSMRNVTVRPKNNCGSILGQDNCVVGDIKDLETKAQSLDVKAIPEFMEALRNATMKNTASITGSAATVQTIVKILTTIAEIFKNKNITVNEPVIENFLTTVDIIISNGTSGTWETLNNANDTKSNTSIELLQAIETISSHLSNTDFNITIPSIQLENRNITGYYQSFSVKSHLNNSRAEVLIPVVSNSSFITILILTNIGNILPTDNAPNNNNRTSENHINGDVIVVQAKSPIRNISLTFDIKNKSLGYPQCVFWNYNRNQWDSDGCNVTGNFTCECNHTTSFSILMSPSVPIDPVQSTALAYITYIGVAISMASLILCLIIEMIVWKSIRRNHAGAQHGVISYLRHVSIVNIAVSLLIANICFIIGAIISNPYENQERPMPVGPCSPVVFFMHFFYLSVFFWMLISALLLLYNTIVVFVQMSTTALMVIAFTVGYGAPLLIAVITVASTAGAENYVSKKNACWLNGTESYALLAFVIPALTIVFINLLILIVVVCKILRRGAGFASQPDERHTLVVILRCVAILTPIFGLTWGFGIGTMVSPEFGIHVVFAILNSFQGFFVLVFGILLDKKVREAVAGRLPLSYLSSSPTRSTNAGTSSSSAPGFFGRWRRNVYNITNPSTTQSANSSGASENLMNP
ncbi:adhesion G protein-coupled receptor F5-like isoform X2 [Triplophysa dalaica]|nr:adhesion G protein-coupled receptor F5-like isoform X2 [Triplophysa dalaica]